VTRETLRERAGPADQDGSGACELGDDMTQNTPQVPWSDEQWGRVNQVVQEEARRARVAAAFLPLFGPLPADTDVVPRDAISYAQEGGERTGRMVIDDRTTIPLPTLQVKVYLRGAQMADPELASALQLFRRAANVLARLEDLVVFAGQPGMGDPPPAAYAGLPAVWDITGAQRARGLLATDRADGPVESVRPASGADLGETLVSDVSSAIGRLEAAGHFGPFALVLGQTFFAGVQTPNKSSLVLPQDRILPFLAGGPLLRTSALPDRSGVVVALGGAPVELVVATYVSVGFLQVTTDPMYVFRVFEKVLLRIKEPDAIVSLRQERQK
jgi:uncharacterized linocin/CFP29 family protein